ncbi:MAG: hypothetical protein P9F75_03030 [Candidatus Contendobacter sp.]|nr:hypothetical protein [Candidatus Contendobacter sp.]
MNVADGWYAPWGCNVSERMIFANDLQACPAGARTGEAAESRVWKILLLFCSQAVVFLILYEYDDAI